MNNPKSHWHPVPISCVSMPDASLSSLRNEDEIVTAFRKFFDGREIQSRAKKEKEVESNNPRRAIVSSLKTKKNGGCGIKPSNHVLLVKSYHEAGKSWLFVRKVVK
jgi:hypothetical protein